MEKTKRPWGTYEILLDDNNCKVKKIDIKPGENPSYQMHFKREEKWVIVSGSGILKLNDIKTEVQEGDVIEIPIESKHTIINTGKTSLIFIEVQLGTYFGEDDIVRLEDKYGRS
tara:strand:- start:30 stop:371 length:342 start_codon:yes stop_codon:yes gene_type:complete